MRTGVFERVAVAVAVAVCVLEIAWLRTDLQTQQPTGAFIDASRLLATAEIVARAQAVVNYPQFADGNFTRVVEYKHLDWLGQERRLSQQDDHQHQHQQQQQQQQQHQQQPATVDTAAAASAASAAGGRGSLGPLPVLPSRGTTIVRELHSRR